MRLRRPAPGERAVRWRVVTPPLLLLLVVVSIEDVRSDPDPLDSRFYAGAGGGPGGMDQRRPFADYDGDTVTLAGRVKAPQPGEVEMDLWQTDPEAPGSRTHLGKLPTTTTGEFSLGVPASFGGLLLEAFQDLTGDGPSSDDPFGRLEVEIGDGPVEGVELLLEEGALAAILEAGGGPEGGSGPDHVEADPGAPGGDEVAGVPGDAPPGTPSSPPSPFADHEGPTVELSGHILAPMDMAIDLDLWQVDPAAPGSRTHVGKMPLQPGAFTLDIPASFGALQLEAFQDLASDGPSLDDPFTRVEVEVGDVPISGLKLALEVGALGDVAEGQAGPRGGVAEHVDAAPGAPGGDPTAAEPVDAPTSVEDHPHVEAPPGAPGGDTTAAPGGEVPAPDPFASLEGPRVKISGTIVYSGVHALLDMDIFQIEPSVQGGRAFVGKEKVGAGAFSISLPVSFDEVDLEVFLDRDGDGPTPGDPYAACSSNPISLTDGDVAGLKIEVTEAPPAAEPAP